MDLEQKVSFGIRAAEVLQNEAYIEAFETIRQELHEAWENSPVRDKDGREEINLMLRMLNRVQRVLESTMETGKLSSLELDHQRKLSLIQKASQWLNE